MQCAPTHTMHPSIRRLNPDSGHFSISCLPDSFKKKVYSQHSWLPVIANADVLNIENQRTDTLYILARTDKEKLRLACYSLIILTWLSINVPFSSWFREIPLGIGLVYRYNWDKVRIALNTCFVRAKNSSRMRLVDASANGAYRKVDCMSLLTKEFFRRPFMFLVPKSISRPAW